MFLLLVIYCCNKASNWIVPKQKELVSSGYPSHQKWVDFPHTHTHNNIRELQEPSAYSQYTSGYTPSEYVANLYDCFRDSLAIAQDCAIKEGPKAEMVVWP